MVEIQRRYVPGRFGQVHLRESGAKSGAVPLICLHATAYSSRSFEALMRQTATERHVVAIDLPGYGESDAPPQALDIAGYAAAVAESICAAVGEQPVALFGYHTGVVIAAEIALQRRVEVQAMTFLGVPFFRMLDFESWKTRLASGHSLGETLDQFDERWKFLVADRPRGLSLRRGFENFVDELKAWPDGSEAHRALFAYDMCGRLPLIDCPVTILNPQGHLAEPSRAAAKLIVGASLIELPELNGAVLDTDPDKIAALIPIADKSARLGNTADILSAGRTSHAG